MFIVSFKEVTSSSRAVSESQPGSSSQEMSAPSPQDASRPDAPAQKTSKSRDSRAARSGDNVRTMEFNTLFGEKKFISFYSVKPTGDADLTKLNMFKVDKSIRDQIGTCRKISEDYANKSWTVEVVSEDQGIKLMKMKKLVKEVITVVPHERHNQSQGVITCSLLKGYSDEDITEGLSEHGVIACRRIIKGMKSPNPDPTSTLILTFGSATPPSVIKIRTGLQERVRPYIPLPMRCYKCQNYGHTGTKCRKPFPICARCGTVSSRSHDTDSCQRPVNCYHCKESHSVSSKSCPRFLIEKEIIALKTKEHLTFAEARARVNRDLPSGTRSYASVTKPQISLIQGPQSSATQDSSQTSTTTATTEQSGKKRPLEDQDCSPIKSKSKEKKIESLPPQFIESCNMETTESHADVILSDGGSSHRRNSISGSAEVIQVEGKILNNARKISKKKAERDNKVSK